MRSQNEFSYGGDASVKRPELNKEISDNEWNDFVYNHSKGSIFQTPYMAKVYKESEKKLDKH